MPHPGERTSPRLARRRAGVTLVELVIAMMVLLVAVSIFGGTVASGTMQREINRENAIATEAARTALEGFLAMPFRARYASYDADPLDDPDGPGTAPGARFDVPGLSPRADAPGGLAGEFVFPVRNVQKAPDRSPIWELREDVEEPLLGMPADLDGDEIDQDDHAEDYMRLPVMVRVRWRSNAGIEREVRLITLSADYDG